MAKNPNKKHPGKYLRKAMANLNARRNSHSDTVNHPRGMSSKLDIRTKTGGFKSPGSMKK